MDRNRKKYLSLSIVLLVITVVFLGCNKQEDLGFEILPKEDLINVKSTIIKDKISAFTFRETGIKTNGLGKSLLGSLTEETFGNTTINFATQVRLEVYPDYGVNPKADSIKLYLYYRVLYGDTVTPQKFKVYELKESIKSDSTNSKGQSIEINYRQEIDLKSMAYTTLLGEVEYTPRIRQDSATADTFYQLITIPLDISLAEKLIQAEPDDLANAEAFDDFFKGLLIETEKVGSTGGTILSLEASASDIWQGSALVVYYQNDSLNTVAVGDTSVIMPYVITEFSSRVNSITHDYTSTPFYQNLDQEDIEDSLVYVQATGGLKSKVNIKDLESWADSANTAINKAELVFKMDTTASDFRNFPPPSQLLFTFIDSTGVERLPIDYFFSPTYYGGILEEDYTYRFNITQHLQQIIKGQVQNNGFFLTPAQKSTEANRVVLKGSSSNEGIKLIVTYSQTLQ